MQDTLDQLIASTTSDRTRRSDRAYWNEAMETMAWSDVERWQAGQIAAMLEPLRARSNFYGRLHAAVPSGLKLRGLADLVSLPFTLKDDVRGAQDRCSDVYPFGENQAVPSEDIVQAIASSGTTGQPLYYALTQRDVDVFTDAIANTWFTVGLRKNDLVAHLVGLPMVAGGLPYADGLRRIGATLCWLGGFPTDRILREMRRLRVTAILATTSFGLYLSEQWDSVGQETGVPSSLTKVLCGGEPGLNQPEIRRRIANGLHIAHLREVMGLGDVISGMWGECDAHDGMHFNAQRYVAIELIDPESGVAIPWKEGVTGEIVYTAFARDATPLIRYRSRDHALVTGVDRCSCGRTSPRIRCIGRTDDMLIYKGMNVFPTSIRDLISERFAGQVEPMLRIWKEQRDQVRFDDPIPVDVEISPGLETSTYSNLAREIEKEVRMQLQVRVAITVLGRGSLPRGAYKNSLVVVRGTA